MIFKGQCECHKTVFNPQYLPIKILLCFCPNKWLNKLEILKPIAFI